MLASSMTPGGPGKGWNRKAVALVVLAIFATLYGSLYPFEFHASGSPGDAVCYFLNSWDRLPRSRGDLIANILFYVPFGLTTGLWLTGRVRVFLLVGICLIAGAALSTILEVLQYFDAGRVSAMSDTYLNSLGSMLGASLGVTWRRQLESITFRAPPGSTFVLFIVLSWLGWRLFPYEPVIDLHKYWASLKPVFLYPSLSPYSVFRYAMIWTAFGYILLRGLKLKLAPQAIGLGVVAIFVAKILIVGLVITVSEIVGATIAVLFLRISANNDSLVTGRALTGLFTLFIILVRLEPWQFSAVAQPFEWIPFYGFLHGSVAVDIQSLLEKFFLYGVLLWLLVHAGLKPFLAATVECLLLLATSIIQTHLPNRSGEVSDALLAAIIAAIYLVTMARSKKSAIGS